jgi:hypothetical protein
LRATTLSPRRSQPLPTAATLPPGLVPFTPQGSLQDDPSSLAFLHVSARDGSVGGMVFAASGAHEISNPDGPRSAGLRTRRADFEDPRFKATVANWTCGTASPG